MFDDTRGYSMNQYSMVIFEVIDLSKLESFTNLNSSAIEGDDFSIETIIYGVRSPREVVIICPD